jgi:GT2 family glycosyltransferase
VTLLANRRNRGFAAACNQGACDSRADYLLFLNPDAYVEPTAIDAAVAAIEAAGARTAIAGVQLVNDDGVPEATCGRFPTLANLFFQLTGLSRLSSARFPAMRMLEWDHRASRQVDFVSGACRLVRRAVYERLGGFDERLFLYLEDADLALRARGLGFATIFSAEASVVHPGGWSRGRDRAWRLAQSWRSLAVYGWKHFDAMRATSLVACLAVVAPAARIGQAVILRSPRDAAVAVRASALFWWLLAGTAVRTLSRGGRRGRPDHTTMATVSSEPAGGRRSPAQVSSTPADEIW